MTADDVRIVFTPSGRRGTVRVGTSILAAAAGLGADLDTICGGRGICGRCQIQQGSSKDIALDPSRLSEPNLVEINYQGARELKAGNRLGCQTEILGDVVVAVPPESQVHRQVVRKRPEVSDIEVDPVVRLYYVEVEEAVLGEAGSGLHRLLNSLEDQWGLDDLNLDPRVLPEMQTAMIDGKGMVTAAVHDGTDVTAVWPGFHDVALGVAFDVGSTTIAGHLCDLESGEILATHGVMNPQIRFGEDVMSRVSFAMLNEDGAKHLTETVQEAIDSVIGHLVEEGGVERSDVLETVLVGNPIMHHMFLGLDARPLGAAPFSLATDEAVRLEAADIGLTTHHRGRVYVLPCVAGHVGADATGAILSEGPHRSNALQLLVDVGTNAEIVLGNAEKTLAASSPTGPAFEGAQISSGQRATPGAIERVRVDPETLEPRIKVIGSDVWSDDPEFFWDAEHVPITGICGSGIIEVIAELFLAGVIDEDGVIADAGRTDRIVPDQRTFAYVLWADPQILITQADVRAVQLAKAALYAGVRLLMDHYGAETVDRIRLAGAFGSHIDPKYAMILGMIPDCDLDAVSAAGNAAGTGAIMALLSGEARTEIEEVAKDIVKVETATEPRFQEHFVNALGIPHKTAENPHLNAVVDLPRRSEGDSRRRRGRKANSE